MKISVVSEMWWSSKILGSLPVRGVLSAKVPNSSFAEADRVLLSERTHMEDEDEDQEIEKEDERDCEECKVES